MTELKGKDFITLAYERQDEMISACLVHSAKNLDKKTKQNDDGTKEFVNIGKQSFVNFINGNEKDDIKQNAWLNCYEKAQAEKYNDLPILLFVTICTTKAISDIFYRNQKPIDNLIDYENTLVSHFDNVEYTVIKNSNLDNILYYIRDEIKATCVRIINLLDYGFSLAETKEIIGISENRFLIHVSAITNAIAMDCMENKEYNKAQKILDTKRAQNDRISKAQAEKMIASYKAQKIENEKPIIKWEDKAQITIDFSKLSYMEKIAFIAHEKELFDKVVRFINK